MPRRSRSFKVGLFRRLQDDAEVLTYLQVALEDSIPAFLVALRNVAEARQMSRVASCSNLDRANLYRMLQEQGNPRLTSLAAVLKTLGVRLSVEADNVRCVEQNDEVRTSHVTILPFEHKRTRYSWANERQTPKSGVHGFISKWDDEPEVDRTFLDEAQLIEA